MMLWTRARLMKNVSLSLDPCMSCWQASSLTTNLVTTSRDLSWHRCQEFHKTDVPGGCWQAFVQRSMGVSFCRRCYITCGASHAWPSTIGQRVSFDRVGIMQSCLRVPSINRSTIDDKRQIRRRTKRAAHSLWAMRVRFAEALHIAHRGRPDADYHQAMKRLQSHGLVLGEKYRSHHFVELVERHCVAALSALTARSMNHFVPSLGIPADLVLLFDGLSIGARQISRYESLLPTACARGPCNIKNMV